MKTLVLSSGSLRQQEVRVLTVAMLGSSALAWAALAAGGPAEALILPLARAPSGAFGLAWAMWLVMIVAMMLPLSLPWVVTFAGFTSGSRSERRRHVGMFLGGYGVVWTAFAMAAAAAQIMLQDVGALAAPGPALSGSIGGAVLVGVGFFQLTSLKEACLSRCRSPVSFFLSSWVDGPAGAFRMGMGHGRFCLGCCWALMVAAFAVGVMNLAWMAVLTVVMGAEKLLPGGKRLGQGIGVASILGGLWLMVGF